MLQFVREGVDTVFLHYCGLNFLALLVNYGVSSNVLYMAHYQAGSNLKAARFLVKQVSIFFQEFGRE